VPGGNYGWPCYEAGAGTPYGTHTSGYSADDRCSGAGGVYSLEGGPLAALPPVYDYPHIPGSFSSITGGPLFPGGTGYPAQYAGRVFFGDYSRGTVSTWDPATGAAEQFASGINSSDLEVAPDGNIAYADVANGTVAEIAHLPDPAPPAQAAPASPADVSGPGVLPGAGPGGAAPSTSVTARGKQSRRCLTAKRSRHHRVRKAARACQRKPKKRRVAAHRARQIR
jgi:hypothetical protein